MQNMNHLPRSSLGFFPTPITELQRLSRHLGGPKIYMKRDDLSGVALGGNKVRKLEYLIGQALLEEADTIVTGGAAQSNHCRQTAAAAVMAGLKCHLALGGTEPEQWRGNLVIDRLLGAAIHWCGLHRKGETIPEICDELRRSGRHPYVVPYGGSSPVGAVGFVQAIEELCSQQHDAGTTEFSHVVFASSSGGTHAGLLLGSHLFARQFELIGIAIDKDESTPISFEEQIAALANETAALLGVKADFTAADLTLNMDYLGRGYGVIGEPERQAIALVAATEGILLDPVYTGRAMAGLIDMIERGRLTSADTVLFWHTGGTPALFACGNELYADTV